jgi:hypothetical protein
MRDERKAETDRLTAFSRAWPSGRLRRETSSLRRRSTKPWGARSDRSNASCRAMGNCGVRSVHRTTTPSVYIRCSEAANVKHLVAGDEARKDREHNLWAVKQDAALQKHESFARKRHHCSKIFPTTLIKVQRSCRMDVWAYMAQARVVLAGVCLKQTQDNFKHLESSLSSRGCWANELVRWLSKDRERQKDAVRTCWRNLWSVRTVMATLTVCAIISCGRAWSSSAGVL